MERKRQIDLIGCALCALTAFLAVWAVEDSDTGMALFFFAAAGFTVFSLLLLKDFAAARAGRAQAPVGAAIRQLLLLNEEDKPVALWELSGKTSVVIGKDLRENQVDVDLSRSAYASMIDVEHAVLNYAGGCWYVEDLDSRNGVVLQKKTDGRKYKLSADQPCKVELGDIVLLGLAKLELH